MEPTYIYPGSFCPPTYGHFGIVKKAAAVLPHVTIVCSRNSEKDYWFSEDECVAMWNAYKLPENVDVTTFFKISQSGIDLTSVILIRGIRDSQDFIDEAKTIDLNFNKLGIDKYLHIVACPELKDISSSQVRQMATDLDIANLHKYVAPLVITALLEKVLDLQSLYMVVGRPGSGKSTFLKMLTEHNSDCIHVNTDEINDELKPLLEEAFPGQDMIEIARTREDELKAVIGEAWVNALRTRLINLPKDKHVFVEVPYGLQPDKNIFRFLGGKVVYVGCDDNEENVRRIKGRGTPEHLPFIDQIPNRKESRVIAVENRLRIRSIYTSGPIDDLPKQIQTFEKWLSFNPGRCRLPSEGITAWEDFPPELSYPIPVPDRETQRMFIEMYGVSHFTYVEGEDA